MLYLLENQLTKCRGWLSGERILEEHSITKKLIQLRYESPLIIRFKDLHLFLFTSQQVDGPWVVECELRGRKMILPQGRGIIDLLMMGHTTRPIATGCTILDIEEYHHDGLARLFS